MNYANDKELLAGCLSGSKDALEDFVRLFSDSVYRIVQYTFKTRNFSYTKADLEDLHNSVFLRLFEKQCRKLRQYQGKNGCSLYSWVRLITVRTVIDHLRKVGVDALSRRKETLSLEALDLKAEESKPWVRIDRAKQQRLVQDRMKELLSRDRLFLKLHFLGDLSIREVAKIMHITEANAHSLKHRAIQRLKLKVLSKLR